MIYFTWERLTNGKKEKDPKFNFKPKFSSAALTIYFYSTHGVLFHRGSWINAGFTVFKHLDLEDLRKKMVQRILATHQQSFITKKILEFQLRQAKAIEKLTENDKILLAHAV